MEGHGADRRRLLSTLSYLPGIAILAVGTLSPLATLLIVALTLFGMLPMYRRVAEESPRGQGSVAMLERLLPFWRGKFFVLALLGFVAISWIVTITLSSEDATAHIVESPYWPDPLRDQRVLITLVLIAILGAVFLRGSARRSPSPSRWFGVYLALTPWWLPSLHRDRDRIRGVRRLWQRVLDDSGGGLGSVLATAVLACRLRDRGEHDAPRRRRRDHAGRPAAQPHRHRKLLTTAAVVMSFYLLATTLVTAVLVPEDAAAEGGEASGRALPMSRTSDWATASAPFTTSAPSSSSGSPARRRWPG